MTVVLRERQKDSGSEDIEPATGSSKPPLAR